MRDPLTGKITHFRAKGQWIPTSRADRTEEERKLIHEAS